MSSRKRPKEEDVELLVLEGKLADKRKKLLELAKEVSIESEQERGEDEDSPLKLYDSDSEGLLDMPTTEPVSPPDTQESLQFETKQETKGQSKSVKEKQESTSTSKRPEKKQERSVKRKVSSSRHEGHSKDEKSQRNAGERKSGGGDRERSRRQDRHSERKRPSESRDHKEKTKKKAVEEVLQGKNADLREELERRRREREQGKQEKEKIDKEEKKKEKDLPIVVISSEEEEPEKDREVAIGNLSPEKTSPSPCIEVIDTGKDLSMETGDQVDNDAGSSQGEGNPSQGSETDVGSEGGERSAVECEEEEEGEGEGDEERVEGQRKERPVYYPAISGCRTVDKEYEYLNRIEEGTYGVVYRARDKKTNEIVALKKVKMEREKEGFPITSLREINMLLKARHPNIVHVREIVVGCNIDKIYIVMDYVEHDLKTLMESMKQPFLVGETKTLMLQLLRAIQHLHDNWILHRDLKLSNLLLSHKGILKVGDFGLAREYGSPLKEYTQLVVTLWYRAPELLLGAKSYSTAIDMWSAGCIFGELLQHKPLFPGKSEIDQVNKIFKSLGTPTEKIWPGWSQLPAVKKVNFAVQPYNSLRNSFPYLTESGLDLLNQFLTYYPSKRISADESLKHKYFKESPLPVDPSMFPTWPAKSELSKSQKRDASPVAPVGGQKMEEMEGVEPDPSGGFHMNLANQGYAAKGSGFSLRF